MRKLRTAVYARMEEMSFRSGAATGAGALAAVGTVIALAVTLTGHSAAATSVPGPTAPAHSAPSVPPSVIPSSQSSPSPSPSPSSTRVRSASPAASPQSYLPASGVTTSRKVPPHVAVRLRRPRRPRRRLSPPGFPAPIPPGWWPPSP
jgi:hypothetical protein